MNTQTRTVRNNQQRTLLHRINCSLLVLGIVILSSCGGGSGVGDSNGSLTGGVNVTRAHYQIIDLSTGQVTAAGSVADLATNPVYRTSKLVVRLISVGSGAVGTGSNALGALIDPSASTGSAAHYYLSVFEITQAQWQLIAGSAPWLLLTSNDGANDIRVGDNYPAIGLSLNLVNSAVQSFRSTSGVKLQLPSDVQWELACRGGGSGTWAWGNTADTPTVSTAAVVWETAGTTRGAREVGGLAPNSLGLFDVHGNVWELTSNTHIRGGSWNDSVTVARAAHLGDIDPATRHLLVGARLVFVP